MFVIRFDSAIVNIVIETANYFDKQVINNRNVNNEDLQYIINALRKNGTIRFDSELAVMLDIPKSNLSLMAKGKRGIPNHVENKLIAIKEKFLHDNYVINNKNPSTVNENVEEFRPPEYISKIKQLEDIIDAQRQTIKSQQELIELMKKMEAVGKPLPKKTAGVE